MPRVLTCSAGNGKRVRWFDYLTFISLVLHEVKSTALLARSWPGKCGKPLWAAI